MNKYRAKKTRLDGYVFDSNVEARRYGELKILERSGEITGLKVHPVFPIDIAGRYICKVILDFQYQDKSGADVYEDVKGHQTALSALKKKMVEAAYSIEVELVR